MVLDKRQAGILLHLTSLPGEFGIGDLGKPARDFVDFLVAAGQSCWQFLPTGPISGAFHFSPYMSLSAFAGNPLLIDPRQLHEDGLLEGDEIEPLPEFSRYSVRFQEVAGWKEKILRQAFRRFRQQGPNLEFEQFQRQREWLPGYALYMALRDHFASQPWCEWPDDLARAKADALEQWGRDLQEEVAFYLFEQFIFFRQWHGLKNYAAASGVDLVGDIPIYVGHDSADVWSNQECFKLNPTTLKPTHVAGVPPDYFSATGQRWGNPLYRWKDGRGRANDALYGWWKQRFSHIFTMVDIVRIDHFRGFEAFWQIPADEETAVNGKWVKGPGKNFFQEMQARIGRMPIIAEDLGIITPQVEKLRDQFGFPGMKILQFAFDSGADNLYLPHNYRTANCVVYPGTHDNDTSLGWIFDPDVAQQSKDSALHYSNNDDFRQIHWHFIRLAFSSIANLAIIPLQDVLGFGNDCRMNLPSTIKDNWQWRCGREFLTPELAARLRRETVFYGRLVRPEQFDYQEKEDE